MKFKFDFYYQYPHKLTLSPSVQKKFKGQLVHCYNNFSSKRPKLVAREMKMFFKIMSIMYGFNYNHFLSHTFKSKRHNLWIISPYQIPEFANGSDSSDITKWLCAGMNGKMIMTAVWHELNEISNTNFKDAHQYHIAHATVVNFKTKLAHLPKHTYHTLHHMLTKTDSTIADELDSVIPEADKLPFYESYRKHLVPLWQTYDKHQYEFTARIGATMKYVHNQDPGMLLRNIYHGTKKLTTHVWLFHNDIKAVHVANAKKGDFISFFASVHMYTKNLHGYESKDFVLSHLNHVHVIC